MRIVEKPLIFSVAAFNLSVMARSIGFNQLMMDAYIAYKINREAFD